MIKKPITYTDFNGVERTEDFYFHMSKAELFKLEVTAEGNSLHEYLQKVVAANSGKKIMEVFELILESAYGVRSEDGKRFMKSEEIFKDFKETNAYSEFFFELVTDAEKAAEFISGLIPSDIREKVSPEDILAAKGGYNKPSANNSIKKVEDLPVEVATASRGEDTVELSREELEARLRAMDTPQK